MDDDGVTALLDVIRERNEERIRFSRYTDWTVEHDVAEGDVRRLLAVADVLLAALERHQHKITDSKGTICAGCLNDWPCPDIERVRAVLLGKEGSDGD